MRYLKQRARPALRLKDLRSRTAIEKLRDMVRDDPNPEYAFLHLVVAALDATREVVVEGHVVEFWMTAEWLASKYQTAPKVSE